MSNTEVNNKEMDFLGKGLKHSISPLWKQATMDNLIADLETQLCFNNELMKAPSLINPELLEEVNPRTKTLIRNIGKEICDNNLLLTKADKRQSIVFLDETEYIAKLMDF